MNPDTPGPDTARDGERAPGGPWHDAYRRQVRATERAIDRELAAVRELGEFKTAVGRLHRKPAVILNHGELVMAYQQTQTLLAGSEGALGDEGGTGA